VRTSATPESLQDQLGSEERQWLDQIAERLRPPPLVSLPVSPQEQVNFLHEHALGGSGWPDNGLTVEENRSLFLCDDPDGVARFTLTGLMRVFGTA
jgi:hypothetical protein